MANPPGQPAGWGGRCGQAALNSDLHPLTRDPAHCLQGGQEAKKHPPEILPRPTFSVESKTPDEKGIHPAPRMGLPLPPTLGCGAHCKRHVPRTVPIAPLTFRQQRHYEPPNCQTFGSEQRDQDSLLSLKSSHPRRGETPLKSGCGFISAGGRIQAGCVCVCVSLLRTVSLMGETKGERATWLSSKKGKVRPRLAP